MRFEILSDIGRKRTVNEDCAAVFSLANGIILAVIADGMGGHRGGDYASSTAIQVIGEQFMEVDFKEFVEEEQWNDWLREVVNHVNRLLYNYASADETLKGMGTTLDIVLIRGRSCLISHTGDSRVYAVNGNGICQVTRDHSYVNVLLDSGEISEEEAASHPQKNWIMKAIGSEKTIEPDHYSIELDEQSYLLLCTDGLSNKVDSKSIHEFVSEDSTLYEKAKKLVDLANEMGGEDNISVILIDSTKSEVNNP